MAKSHLALSILKWVFITILLFLIVIICLILFTRFYNANQSAITTENGIQEDTFVTIGGIKQFIQIRGEDKDNPVILMLHGGPGCPTTFVNYYFDEGIIDEYTMVSWDQRGSGRTYYENPDMAIEKDLTKETLLNDIDQLVDYLSERFDQDKIIIMGHSWGTVLGSLYSNRHPEKVRAYIGVGQVTDFDEGKIRAAEEAEKIAEAKGETKDVELLKEAVKIYSGSKDIETHDFDNTLSMITTSLKYFRSGEEMSGMKNIWTGLTSPDMSFNDIRWYLIASDFKKIIPYEKTLIQYMFFDFNIKEDVGQFKVPVLFISGDCDWITPAVMVEDYFENLNAPWKKMYLIKNAGHVPFMDKPEAFCEAVKEGLGSISVRPSSLNELIPSWSC